MKKLKIILLSAVLIIIALFIGYRIGNQIGQITGAQQFTKKLLIKNEITISTNSMLDQINNFRMADKKNPLEESIGICKLAQKRAEILFNEQSKSWDQTTQEYKVGFPDEPSISLDEAKKLCPECLFIDKKELDENYYGELNYFILRPDICSEANKKSDLPCKGDEEWGITEHFPERILKQWTDSDSFKPTLLLDNYDLGCVQSYGGSVVFSIAVKK